MSKMKYLTLEDQVSLSITNSTKFLHISTLPISTEEKNALKAEFRLSLVLGTNIQHQLEREYLDYLCSYMIALYMKDPYRE